MITIILSHPWSGSFNKAILDTVTAKLDSQNKPYQVIDLNKDGFNPVLTEQELAGYSVGRSIDPLVAKYQKMLTETSEIVFIFPVWWMTVPAILKGFFDKVMLKDFAFNFENGWNPLLNIDKSTVITTAEQTREAIVKMGDPISGFVLNSLNAVGINNAVWLSCGEVSHGTNENRLAFLKEIESHFEK